MLAIGASCVTCLRYCHHSHEDTAASIYYLTNSLRLSSVRRLTFSAIQNYPYPRLEQMGQETVAPSNFLYQLIQMRIRNEARLRFFFAFR